MVSSIFGSQSSSILAGVPSQPTTPSGSTASFTDQLAAALEGYLAQSGNNSSLEIDIQAAQPPAVQQLGNVADFGARNALAQQLSEEGYTIDRAIMVWGWDPVQTMQTRKMYGYSWVPSFNQSSVSAAPGFALPGETPYDPGNPPPGSIAVNTNFANGLNLGDSLS